MNSFGYIKSKFCAFIFAAEKIKEADSEPFLLDPRVPPFNKTYRASLHIIFPIHQRGLKS